MIRYLHNIAFAILPAIVPTPRPVRQLTNRDIIQGMIGDAKGMMFVHKLQRCKHRAEEKKLEIEINELEIMLQDFDY